MHPNSNHFFFEIMIFIVTSALIVHLYLVHAGHILHYVFINHINKLYFI